MKQNKDPRINAGYISIKDYLVLVFILAVLNAFILVVFNYFVERGMVATNPLLVRNVIRASILITGVLFMIGITFVRHVVWNRPILIFSEAAKKVAMGDFTVRIPPLRKDGKKDFIEVMFDDFNTMVQELASTETMKNDFIANVSHEIKTPLSVIQSYASALQRDAVLQATMQATLPAEERMEYAQTIIEAAQKLSTMTTNILKLNKLENQEIVPEAKTFDLGEHFRRCAGSFLEIWERKNIIFEADIDEIYVCYDTHMLEIVWNNLLSNAIKFTNPGGKITASLKAQNDVAVISITDTGIGIDSDTQKHIFDKFYQGDSSHSGEGNGLGLALVKKTLELLDGTISVNSALGHGSTFAVRLKL